MLVAPRGLMPLRLSFRRFDALCVKPAEHDVNEHAEEEHEFARRQAAAQGWEARPLITSRASSSCHAA